MIRIQRSGPPRVLVSRGSARTRKDCEAYEADPAAYRRGDAGFKADAKIYGHHTVKASLLRAQRGKCCYCERKILATDYGDVEHFRPNTKSR
jgi:hypothetical protein